MRFAVERHYSRNFYSPASFFTAKLMKLMKKWDADIINKVKTRLLVLIVHHVKSASISDKKDFLLTEKLKNYDGIERDKTHKVSKITRQSNGFTVGLPVVLTITSTTSCITKHITMSNLLLEPFRASLSKPHCLSTTFISPNTSSRALKKCQCLFVKIRTRIH